MELVHGSSKTLSSLFFAYDRLNYSRYLTAHYYDLLALETNFPEILEEFQNGNFSVQMSTGNPFGRMEADKVIETTINRDTKTPGKTTGMYHSSNPYHIVPVFSL